MSIDPRLKVSDNIGASPYTLNENRNCKNVMLYNIITQTTKTLQTRY
jgi:hypothetical protein